MLGLFCVKLFAGLCSRFGFSGNSGGGCGIGDGGFVEQGYASLVCGCGTCFADCWMRRLVVVGPPWRTSLRQSQLSDVLQRTRVQWEQFDYNNRAQTVSNANPARVTAMFQLAAGRLERWVKLGNRQGSPLVGIAKIFIGTLFLDRSPEALRAGRSLRRLKCAGRSG